MKLLEAKRALRYGLYQLTGISDRELFDHRASLAKAGRHIVGALYLPDGTEVGTVLSMFSMPTQGADAAAEIQWHDASGYEVAKTGDLSIKDDRVTLVEADSMTKSADDWDDPAPGAWVAAKHAGGGDDHMARIESSDYERLTGEAEDEVAFAQAIIAAAAERGEIFKGWDGLSVEERERIGTGSIPIRAVCSKLSRTRGRHRRSDRWTSRT